MALRRREMRLSSAIDRLGAAMGLSAFSVKFGAGVFVNPTGGNDSNSGRTRDQAWRTWGKLVASIGSLPEGDWVDSHGRDQSYRTITSLAAKDAWNAAYLAGDRFHTGSQIILDTTGGPLQVTAPLTLGKRVLMSAGALALAIPFTIPTSGDGGQLSASSEGIAGRASLVVNLTLPAQSFTRPNSGTYPHVYKTANAYPLALLYEAGAQLNLINGGSATGIPDLATALPLMTAGSQYVDPADNKIVFWPIAGGDPNSDGVVRTYSPSLLGGADANLIDITGGFARNLYGKGGALYNPALGLPVTQALFGISSWQSITVRDSCLFEYVAGKHSSLASGNDAGGMFVRVNDVFSYGPGGTNTGNWDHDVDYSSQATAGTSATYYNGSSTVATWANVGSTGGSDAPAFGPANARIIHDNGGGAVKWSACRMLGCHWRGFVSLGGSETALATATNTVFDYSVGVNCPTTFTGCTINYRFPDLQATTSLVNTILLPSLGFAGNCNLQGTVTMSGGSLTQAASGNSSQWIRLGAVSLTLTNVVISTQTFQLLSALSPTDTLAFVGCRITGVSSANPLVGSYNGGGALSWATAFLNGTTGVSFTGGNTYNGSAVGS